MFVSNITVSAIFRLLRVMPEESIGSKYLLQVSLVKQMAKELRDLYVDVHGSAREQISKRSIQFLRDDEDDVMSVSEVFMGVAGGGGNSSSEVIEVKARNNSNQ